MNKLLVWLFSFYLFVCNVNALQVEQLISGGGTSLDWSWAVAVDSNGSSYITGSISGFAAFGQIETGFDISPETQILVKINSNGEFEWIKYLQDFGDPENMNLGTAMGVGVDSQDNVYFSGYFTYSCIIDGHELHSNGVWDIFLVKFSSAGDLIWARSFGGTGYDIAHGMCVAKGNDFIDDYIYLTGWYGSEIIIDDLVIPNMGGSDIFIAKFNTSGEIDDFIYAGNEMVNYAYQIDSGINGEIAIVGSSSGSLDFPIIGSIEFAGTYLYHLNQFNNSAYYSVVPGISPFRVAVDNNNATIIAGRLLEDAFINNEWFYLYNDQSDGIVVKSSGPGDNNIDWVLAFHGSGEEVVRAVNTDSQNNVIIALTITDSLSVFGFDFYTDTDEDLIVFKISPDGQYLNHLHIPCNGSIKATDIKVNNNDEIIITGWYSGEILVGGYEISTSNYYDLDMFFIKISTSTRIDNDTESQQCQIFNSNNIMSVYPNPLVVSKLKVSFTKELSSQAQVSIFNVKGQKLYSSNLSKNNQEIDLSNFKSGLYFIRVQDNSLLETKKLLIIK